MKRSPSLLAILVLGLLGAPFTWAQHEPPAGYYDAAEGLTGTALESSLHDIIDNHRRISWGWPAFQALDESPTDSSKVLLVYSDILRSKNDHGGDAGEWNREHVWPKSYGLGSGSTSDIDEVDLHNVVASDVQVNSARGSLYFDETDAALENTPAHPSAPDCSKDGNSWEPQLDRKGDVARICFYMAVRYDGSDSATMDLTLGETPNASAGRMGRLSTLLRWHREDPVSEAERLRNDRIFDDWQRNRNPFIDVPSFAELLFLADSPQTDNDGDGLSDFWEAEMLGHLDSDAQDDSDQDRVPLLLEQAFRMDPLVSDEARLPEILNGPSPNTQIVRFRWSRSLAPYLSYTLEGSPTMEPDTWMTMTSEASSEDLDAEVSQIEFLLGTESIDSMFYRLQVTALP